MKNIKKALIIICLLSITFLSLNVITATPTKASANKTIESAIAEFTMEYGAAVRKKDDKLGLRFNAILPEQAFEVLQSANAKFGMIIVPKDYVTEGYELTVENVFGENAVYVPNVAASDLAKQDETKKSIIQITNPSINKTQSVYKIYGAIVNLLEENISRGFIGRAYVFVNGKYYFASYADCLVENNTRSMAYVAKRAIDDGDKNSDILQSTYIDKVSDKILNYSINKITVDLDGTITKEKIESGSSLFGEPINYTTERCFGYNHNNIDTFASMDDQEFNVIYTATPVNVVIDLDATSTELYAANELADYITQITGVATTVGIKSSDFNNIYISTTPSLGLSSDSFRLYTDENKNVYINGTDERGTLYGVYEFEEFNLGVKFLSESYTYVPVTNKQINGLKAEQERDYSPAFAYRTYMNNGVGLDGNDNVKYSSHLRFVSQFSQEKTHTELMEQVQYFMPWMAKPWLSASHSIITYAAVGAYLKGLTHLVDVSFDSNGHFTSCSFKSNAGKDSTYGAAIDDTVSIAVDVCYSSETAKEWVILGLKYMIDTYPEMEYFMLGQADKNSECDCSTCKKAIVPSFSNWWSPTDNKSDLVARFIKDVVTAVNANGEKYSSKKIVMFAYLNTEPAPKHKIEMPNNVYVQWAPIEQDRYFALDSTNPNNWKTQLGIDEGRFLIWSYEVNFAYYFNYYPTMHTWVDNFEIYKDLGVEAIVMQSTWNTQGVADSYLEAYVASKLLWNFKDGSKEEMNELIYSARDEFIQYFYGDAAKNLIIKYYDDFDSLYATKFGKRGYLNANSWSFTLSELNSQINLIDQAISLTTDPTHLKHLEMLSLTPRYMRVQYCGYTDNRLANDMSNYATKSREGTDIANDEYLKGLSFTKGYASVLNVTYDDKNRISELTLEIPDNTEWSGNAPRLTENFLNELVNSGVYSIAIEPNSTAKTGLVTTMYNGVVSWTAPYVFELVKNGGDLRISYVDVSGKVHSSGQTIGTTLTIKFNYYAKNEPVADEIGLTIADTAVIVKNSDGSYSLSNVGKNTGGFMSAYISAEQVNKWIDLGYTTISMTVSFTASSTIDQVVGLNGTQLGAGNFTELKTDESGYAEWTFTLVKDSPIQFWAQKNYGANVGTFTLANVKLN